MIKKDTILKDSVYKFFTEQRKQPNLSDLYLKITEVNPYYIVVSDSHHLMIAQFDPKSLLDKENFLLSPGLCLYIKKASLTLHSLPMDITSLLQQSNAESKPTLAGIEIITEIKSSPSTPSSSPSKHSRPVEDIEFSYSGLECRLLIHKFSVISAVKYSEIHEISESEPHTKNLFEVDEVRTAILYFRFLSVVSGLKAVRKAKKAALSCPGFSDVFKSGDEGKNIDLAEVFGVECSQEELWFWDVFDEKGEVKEADRWGEQPKEKTIRVLDRVKAEEHSKFEDAYRKRVERYKQEIIVERVKKDEENHKFIKLPKSLRPKKEKEKAKEEKKKNMFWGEKRKDEEKRKIDFNSNATREVEKVLKNLDKLTAGFLKLPIAKTKKDKKGKSENLDELKEVNYGKFQSFILWIIEKQSNFGIKATPDKECKEENGDIIKTKLDNVNTFFSKDQDFSMKLKGKVVEILGEKHKIDFGETVESSKKLIML